MTKLTVAICQAAPIPLDVTGGIEKATRIAGAAIGRVIAVQNYGATDILEIEKDPAPAKGLKTSMVPMTKQAVIEWDTEKLVISADFADV